MATIALSDGFIPSSKDTPLDKRTRVNLYEEIQNIKNPYVGMEILVLTDETNSGRKTRYRVESLKANDLGMENALIDMTTIKKIESYEVNLEELIHITKAKIDEFLLNPVLDAEGVAYERQLYQIDNLIPFDIEDEYIARIGTEEIVIKVKEIDRLEFIGYDKSIKLHLNLDNTGEYNENYACLEFVGITVDNSNDLYIYKSDTIYINEDVIPKCYPKETKVREIIDRALENINSIEYEELETTDNTIIGAINELKRALDNITTDDSGEAVNLPFNSIDKGLASSNIDFSEIKNGSYCYIIRGSIGYDVPEGNLPLNNDMVHITKSNIAMTVITLNGDIYTYNGGTNGTNYISCTKDNFMAYSVASETYQPKNDSRLITNDKTVVGAINELKNALDSVDGAFTILTVSPTYEELDTLPEGGKVYILNGLGIDGDPVHIYKSGNNITITTIYGTINKYIKSGTTWTNYSTEETTTKSYVDRAIANAQLGDLTEYQKITDNSLVTIDKTIVGAINELKSNVDGIIVPTKTSDLINDSGFITSIPSEYITETELETKGYLTEHQDISNLALKSEIPDVSSFITSDDLPTVPTKVSDLANDRNYISSIPSEYVTETELNAKGYLTEHQDISNLQSKTDNSLTTTDKTIVGAINEIDEQYETIKTKVDKIEQGDTLATTSIIDSTLTLTTDKLQTTIMQDNTTIVLPSVSNYIEIHLFFNTESELTLILPNIKWQSDITIEANKTYEFIFTYYDSWLGGCLSYE